MVAIQVDLQKILGKLSLGCRMVGVDQTAGSLDPDSGIVAGDITAVVLFSKNSISSIILLPSQ